MGAGASLGVSAALSQANIDEVVDALIALSPDARVKVLGALGGESIEGAGKVQVIVREGSGKVVLDGILPNDMSCKALADHVLRENKDLPILPNARQQLCGTPEEMKWQMLYGILDKYRKGYKPSVLLLFKGQVVEPSTTLGALSQAGHLLELAGTFQRTVTLETSSNRFVLKMVPSTEKEFYENAMKGSKKEDFTTCACRAFMEALRNDYPGNVSPEAELFEKFEELAEGAEGMYSIGPGSFEGFLAGHSVTVHEEKQEE